MYAHIGAEALANVVRSYSVLACSVYGQALADSDRLEESIAALRRVTEHVRPDDSSQMRHAAAKALISKGEVLSKLKQQEDAIGAWNQATAQVRTEDPVELRSVAVHALGNICNAMFPVEIGPDATLDSFQGSIAAGELMAEYVRPDDPATLRDGVTEVLLGIGMLRCVFGDFGRAEAACKKATDIGPSHAESWRVRAEAILRQGDDARLPEAEDYARRAVDLTPENTTVFRTLAEVLASLGKWTEALNWLEKSLLESGEELPQSESVRINRAIESTPLPPATESASRDSWKRQDWRNPWSRSGTQYGLNWVKSSNPCPRKIMETVTEIRDRFPKE